MNIDEYISSGILESYALGEVTEAERSMVEQALQRYPEVREEFRIIEDTLEKIVFASTIAPHRTLREKIVTVVPIRKPATKIVSMTPERPVWKLAAAASITVALIASYFAFYYHQQWQETSVALSQIIAQNQQMAKEYNVVNQKLDKLQGDLSIIENTAFTKVVMKGTANDTQALASVYWNSSTQEVFLSIQQLRAISKENQFQLWAIVNGKPVDAGVFDMNFAGLLKMKKIAGAAAFAITIEARGGKQSPTMETMQVIGSVVSRPS